tara:strand:- start:942 stop:1106 length:165 start_codon:yes stop_codon:yes gene_type:complete
VTKEEHPIPGRQYLLIGGTGDKCISNGNDWHECLIQEDNKTKVQREKQSNIFDN